MNRYSPSSVKIGVTGWTRGAPLTRTVARYDGFPRSRSATNAASSGSVAANVPQVVITRGRPSGLRDPDHVARGVAERAVPGTPGLGHGLLEHLGARCPDLLERGVEVVGAEDRDLQ